MAVLIIFLLILKAVISLRTLSIGEWGAVAMVGQVADNVRLVTLRISKLSKNQTRAGC